MKQEEIINGFDQLGIVMTELGKGEKWQDFSIGITRDEYESLSFLIERQVNFNGWFTKENVQSAFFALGNLLNEEDLLRWAGEYSYANKPHSIGIVMAGNIPLVGFHDFLCVLISGNKAVCKLSSEDKTLLPVLADMLIRFCPGLAERIEFPGMKIGQIDAVIATGSNNSMKYFEQYFAKIPHIFRHNRTSVALITGNETKEDFEKLGEDIFSYFGLGCRNVSHLLLPEGFEINRFFEGIYPYSDVINNNKYGNNYDYNKAIYLMNKLELLDNNFVLLRESRELHSPLAMIHYHYYDNIIDAVSYIEAHKDQIQVLVGRDFLPFGETQKPGLSDYADNVDVMRWLQNLI